MSDGPRVSANGYPAFAVTVDLAVLTIRSGALSVLLVERASDPYAATWALPGGFVGVAEDAETAARRELREETGITARELLPLGPFYPAAAYSDEVIWMYLARGLTFGEQQLDDDEFLNLQAVPLEELARDVLAGRIPDAKTQAAILRVYCMEHGFEPK